MKMSIIIAPRTSFVDKDTGIHISNFGDRHIAVQWDTVARTLTTTPEEERESKALFINSRGIADSGGNWITRVHRGPTYAGEDTPHIGPIASEDETVADNDATPDQPTDVRLNIFKLFE